MSTSISPKTKALPRLRPSPWDALVVLAVLALTAVLTLVLLPKGAQGGALTCTVSQNGAVLDTFPLSTSSADEERAYGAYIVEVSEGRVRVEEAPCANQDCVHTGYISRGGQSIVCLPGRFVVELSSAEGEDVGYDIVVR